MKFYVRISTTMGLDPKIQPLSDRSYRIWIELLQFAGREDKDGRLGTAKEILQSIAVRMNAADLRKHLSALLDGGLLSVKKEKKADVFIVRNWSSWQARASETPAAWAERKRKERERKKEEARRRQEPAAQSPEQPVTRDSHESGRVTEGMSRECHAAEDRILIVKPLKPQPTTTARDGDRPVDNSASGEPAATLRLVCSPDSSDEEIQSVSEALGDHFPHLTRETYFSLFKEPGGWWHKKFYAELTHPMPPAPRQVLDTIERALLETGAEEPR